MRRLLTRRPSPAMVVAFIALMAALAPTAAALKGVNVVSSNDIITGAVKKSEAGRDSVSSNEVLEDTDPGGGLTGAQITESKLGAVPTATGLAKHAVINGSDGKASRGKGVSSSTRTAAGRYDVVFDRDVRSCTYLATLAGDSAGTIAAQSSATSANAVRVSTFEGGLPTNRSFHLALAC
jgi:hypothetical protein